MDLRYAGLRFVVYTIMARCANMLIDMTSEKPADKDDGAEAAADDS